MTGLWGEGCGWLLDWSRYARWLVVEIDEDTPIIDLRGKVKFPTCTVVHVGDRESATSLIRELGARGPVVGITLTGGDGSVLLGGDKCMLTGGAGSKLTGGDGSLLTGGRRSTLIGGRCSTLTSGPGSNLTGGPGSLLTGSTGSTLTGGDASKLTGGPGSLLIGGVGSTLTGGGNSVLKFHRAGYASPSTAIVGVYGIRPGVAYRLNSLGHIVEA